jgi:hypothetical protein
MNLKLISLGIAAVMVATAVMASSASATVATTRAEWYTGASPGTTLTVGTDEETKMELAFHSDGLKHWVFTTTIAGLPVELTGTAVSCDECRITNKAVTEKAGEIAYGTGTLTLENVKVVKPASCTVESETGELGKIKTKLLEMHGDWMDTTTANKKAFIQFRPDNGGTVFFQFKVGGAGCEAIAGPYNVTGSLFAESRFDTGVFSTAHEMEFSAAVQSTAGAGLKVGANAATLTGTVLSKLVSGKAFAIKP